MCIISVPTRRILNLYARRQSARQIVLAVILIEKYLPPHPPPQESQSTSPLQGSRHAFDNLTPPLPLCPSAAPLLPLCYVATLRRVSRWELYLISAQAAYICRCVNFN